MTQPPDATGAASRASDPTTDPQQLADIAYQHPELRAAVAANPAAYPGLVDWLRSLHDPQVDAALAARDAGAPGTPAAAGAAAAAPTPAQPDSAEPQASAPSAATAGAPGAPVGAPGYVPGAEPGAAQGHPGYPAAAGGPGYGEAATPIAPRRSRTGVWIGLGAAVVVLVGGGAFAANKLWFSKVDGADTARGAVTNMVDGLTDGDMVAVYGATSPAEVDYIKEGTKVFASYFDDVDGFKDLASDIDPQDYGDVFTVGAEGLTLDDEELDAVTSRVTVTAGTLTLDVSDPDKLVDLVERYASTAKDVAESFGSTDETDAIDAEDEAEMRKQIAATFPVTATIKDGSVSYTTASGDESGSSDTRVSVISVEESGKWYVSPLLTIADYAIGDTDSPRGSLEGVEDVKGASSPEAAGQALVTGTVESLKKGDVAGIGDYLPLAERRVFAFVAGAADMSAAGDTAKSELAALATPKVEFSERRKDGDLSWLEMTSFSTSYSQDGTSVDVSFADGCLTVTGVADKICMSDSPGFKALGIEDLSLVAVHEDGGWFASPILTVADGSGVVLSKIAALAKDGKLTSDWFAQNFGGLTSLAGGFAGEDLSGMGLADAPADAVTPEESSDVPDDQAVPDDSDAGSGSAPADASGSEGDAATTALVAGELKKAAPALTKYLQDNPDASVVLSTDLADYGYTIPEDKVYMSLGVEDPASGTFCISATDTSTYSTFVSIDEAGKVYDGISCME